MARARAPRGWKLVSSSPTGRLYTMPLPQSIIDRMKAAAKEPRVFAMGGILGGFFSRGNGRKS
jgi:hypothetical protein